jgi:hypothetical protein
MVVEKVWRLFGYNISDNKLIDQLHKHMK